MGTTASTVTDNFNSEAFVIYPETAKQDAVKEVEVVTEISIAVNENTVEVKPFEPSEPVSPEESKKQGDPLKNTKLEGPIFVTSISVVSEAAVTSPTTTSQISQSTSTATTTTPTTSTTTTTTSTTTTTT